MSAPLPAGNPIVTLIGRSGYDCASAGPGRAEDCRARLDGKVYRYATFVAQVAGRAKAVMQQRIDALPRSFPVQVKVVPGAK